MVKYFGYGATRLFHGENLFEMVSSLFSYSRFTKRWPAIAVNPADLVGKAKRTAMKSRGKKHAVLFYATNDYSFPTPAQVKPYKECREEMVAQSINANYKSDFDRSVLLADKEIELEKHERTGQKRETSISSNRKSLSSAPAKRTVAAPPKKKSASLGGPSSSAPNSTKVKDPARTSEVSDKQKKPVSTAPKEVKSDMSSPTLEVGAVAKEVVEAVDDEGEIEYKEEVDEAEQESKRSDDDEDYTDAPAASKVRGWQGTGLILLRIGDPI